MISYPLSLHTPFPAPVFPQNNLPPSGGSLSLNPQPKIDPKAYSPDQTPSLEIPPRKRTKYECSNSFPPQELPSLKFSATGVPPPSSGPKNSKTRYPKGSNSLRSGGASYSLHKVFVGCGFFSFLFPVLRGGFWRELKGVEGRVQALLVF